MTIPPWHAKSREDHETGSERKFATGNVPLSKGDSRGNSRARDGRDPHNFRRSDSKSSLRAADDAQLTSVMEQHRDLTLLNETLDPAGMSEMTSALELPTFKEVKLYDKEVWQNVTSLDPFRVMPHAFTLFSSIGLAVLLGLAILTVWTGYLIGLFPSKISRAITDREYTTCQHLLGLYFLYEALESALLSLQQWVADRLAVLLRKRLVQGIHERYLRHNTFHDILLHEKFVDNPDGRIANDCMEWATMHMTLLIQLTQMPVYIVWYGIQTVSEMGGAATGICIAFGVLSILLCRLVMTPLIRLTYRFEASNATYRVVNVRIKENAEGVALNQGMNHEYSLLEAAIAKAMGFQLRLANYTIGLNVVSNTFNYFGNVLVYVCIYFSISAGMSDADLAEYVGRVSMIVINLLYGMTMIMLVMETFAKLSGVSTRIQELVRVLHEHVENQTGCVEDNSQIALRNVKITRPSGQVILENLSFAIRTGDSLLISGPSGSGKSSILRVLGRVWPVAEGMIRCPRTDSPNAMLVLTQTPYLPVGSLYEVIAFPKLVAEVPAEKILEAIRFVDLQHLLNRPTEIWAEGLSSGEKQRVALARIFVHEPRFALLDEATNAIPVRMERKIYQRIQELGIAVITIAHRTSLRAFHRTTLALNGDGSYQLTE
jgi:ABC-type uncharacterized transport system fused permease/ATPase subunit